MKITNWTVIVLMILSSNSWMKKILPKMEQEHGWPDKKLMSIAVFDNIFTSFHMSFSDQTYGSQKNDKNLQNNNKEN